MPLTLVQSATALSAGSVASVTATLGATPTPGNLLIALSIGDSWDQMNNTGWTARSQTGDFVSVNCFEKIAGASEPTAIQINSMSAATGGTSNPTSIAVWVAEYSGNTAT